jgi:hypothetical protein
MTRQQESLKASLSTSPYINKKNNKKHFLHQPIGNHHKRKHLLTTKLSTVACDRIGQIKYPVYVRLNREKLQKLLLF